MSVTDILAQANAQAATATANAQPQEPVTIEQPQAAANPLAGFSQEQIAALAALAAQQQPAAQPAQPTQPAQQVVSQPAISAPQMAAPMNSPMAPAIGGNEMLTGELAKFNIGAASLEDADRGNGIVDAWVKPSYAGMQVNDVTVKPFRVIIDMNEGEGLTANHTVRYMMGDDAQYIKSYDGIKTTEGVPWNVAIQQVMATANKVDRPHVSFDVIMTAAEDVLSMEDGSVVVEEGTVLGYGTSATGTPLVNMFRKAAIKEGFADTEFDPTTQKNRMVGSDVSVLVSNVKKTKGKNKWGILSFTDLQQPE